MTNDPDFIDKIIDDMSGEVGFRDWFDTTRADVRAAIERGIRESRPDHPMDSCEDCGHQSDCATHNMSAEKPGRCTCRTAQVGEDGRWRVGDRLATDEEAADAIWGSRPRRTLTVDLDTGEWVRGGPLTQGDGYRIASSVLPGMPREAVSAAYMAYMTDDKRPRRGVPVTPELCEQLEKRSDS